MATPSRYHRSPPRSTSSSSSSSSSTDGPPQRSILSSPLLVPTPRSSTTTNNINHEFNQRMAVAMNMMGLTESKFDEAVEDTKRRLTLDEELAAIQAKKKKEKESKEEKKQGNQEIDELSDQFVRDLKIEYDKEYDRIEKKLKEAKGRGVVDPPPMSLSSSSPEETKGMEEAEDEPTKKVRKVKIISREQALAETKQQQRPIITDGGSDDDENGDGDSKREIKMEPEPSDLPPGEEEDNQASDLPPGEEEDNEDAGPVDMTKRLKQFTTPVKDPETDERSKSEFEQNKKAWNKYRQSGEIEPEFAGGTGHSYSPFVMYQRKQSHVYMARLGYEWRGCQHRDPETDKPFGQPGEQVERMIVYDPKAKVQLAVYFKFHEDTIKAAEEFMVQMLNSDDKQLPAEFKLPPVTMCMLCHTDLTNNKAQIKCPCMQWSWCSHKCFRIGRGAHVELCRIASDLPDQWQEFIKNQDDRVDRLQVSERLLAELP